MLNVELSGKSMNTEYAATTILFSGQKKNLKKNNIKMNLFFRSCNIFLSNGS